MHVTDDKGKMAVKAKAKELGAAFTKMSTKKVSFEGFGYGSKVFVYFEALSWKGENKWDELAAFAKEHGFVLGSKGIS